MTNIRWVFHTFWPELPQVEYAIIAMWWPWEYYCVSTTRVWPDDQYPIDKNTRKNSDLPEEYVTHVYKCDKHGVNDKNYSYYMKEYSDLISANKGHRELVASMEKCRLKITNLNNVMINDVMAGMNAAHITN